MIPKNPHMDARIIKKNRVILKDAVIMICGTTKDDMADTETTIIRTLLVKPASTAAVPITIPPTMPIVCPILEGSLAPASLNNSIIPSIINASITGLNGTLLLD